MRHGRYSRHAPTTAALAAVLAACSASYHDGAGPATGEPGDAVAVTSTCPAASTATREVRREDAVTYVTRDGVPLQLDVAWPADGTGPYPLLVLLHGGGWEGGSRASLYEEMLAFARQGYAAATVDYRLTRAPRDVFPAAVADVRCAVRFLRSRADRHRLAPDRVAAVGFSAGAHLASMLGTAADVAGLDEPCPADGGGASVSAVVSYAGPQDLRVSGPYTQEQARLVTNFLGVFPGDDPERAALASPIVHVSAGDPPFLLVHGTADPLVPVDQSRRMAAALRRVGTPATVLELRGVGHSFVGLSESVNTTVRCTTAAFLARWLGG